MEEHKACFSCGAKALNLEGEAHSYMLSSPGCWAMFGEVLEREYSDFRYASAHHYTVDAYAVQHPGEPGVPQAQNSVGIHLASLFMHFEQDLPLSESAQLKQNFAAFNKEQHLIEYLTPPASLGDLTVFEVWDSDKPDAHFDLCQQWALAAWQAWYVHHATIALWVDRFQNA